MIGEIEARRKPLALRLVQRGHCRHPDAEFQEPRGATGVGAYRKVGTTPTCPARHPFARLAWDRTIRPLRAPSSRTFTAAERPTPVPVPNQPRRDLVRFPAVPPEQTPLRVTTTPARRRCTANRRPTIPRRAGTCAEPRHFSGSRPDSMKLERSSTTRRLEWVRRWPTILLGRRAASRLLPPGVSVPSWAACSVSAFRSARVRSERGGFAMCILKVASPSQQFAPLSRSERLGFALASASWTFETVLRHRSLSGAATVPGLVGGLRLCFNLVS